MTSEREVHEACKVIVANQDSKALNWCVNYARAALSMSGEALRVQVPYVLNNMTHWRGEEARRVRAMLKSFVQ